MVVLERAKGVVRFKGKPQAGIRTGFLVSLDAGIVTGDLFAQLYAESSFNCFIRSSDTAERGEQDGEA